MKKEIAIVLILAFLLVGFVSGMKYQEHSQQKTREQRISSMTGQRIGTSQRTGSNMVKGEILKSNGDNLTVKLPDESSKIILVSDNTNINKATEGTKDDLKNGEQVMIFGQTNSDGSISATNIQLGSELRFNRQEQREQP